MLIPRGYRQWCATLSAAVGSVVVGFLFMHAVTSVAKLPALGHTRLHVSGRPRGSWRSAPVTQLLPPGQSLWLEASRDLAALRSRHSSRDNSTILLKLSPCTFGQLKQPPAKRSCVVKDDGRHEIFNGSYHVVMKFVPGAGLGNLMWQYSVLWVAARQYHMTPVIWERELIFDHFKVTMKPNKERYGGMSWPKKSYPFPDNETATDARLEGYNQNFTNIQDYVQEIRQEFTFRDRIRRDTVLKLRAALNSLGDPTLVFKLGNHVRIGVHVRRGDFLSTRQVEHGFTVASGSYLHKAMDFFRQRFENTIFVVITNDWNWTTQALTNTSADVVYFSGTRYDLYVASTCHHMIITVGTFGWWAGLLSGGTTVYYKNFPRKDSPYGRSFDPRTYYPPDWIGIGD